MDETSLRHQLGLSLLKKLCKDEIGNFVFSPLSLGTAFAMMTAGLRGDTKDELLTFLGSDDEDRLHELYSDFIACEELPLSIANKYVVQDKIEIKPEYNALLKSKYQSEVETVDFKTEGRAAEKKINQWVSDKTSGMIENLLPDGFLTPDIILVLLNALYFKGTWAHAFKPVEQKLDFTLRDATVVKKDFMTQTSGKFIYHETKHLQLVKIPYSEAGCFMVVALPVEGNKHIDDALLETTTSDWASALDALQGSFQFQTVELTMPKFKIEYNFEKVMGHMRQLGVQKIFQRGVGDFSDMFSNSGVSRKTEVSAVVHKCVIEVDEKGTKAAAATAVGFALFSTFSRDPLPIKIKLDKPFYFSVVLNDGTPIFSGICANP